MDIIYKVFFTGLIFFIENNSFAQTYETEKLKIKVEKETLEKKTLSGDNSDIKEIKNEDSKPAFDYNIIASLYKLQKVDAIDINHKHSKKQMKAFMLEAQREFESKDRAVDLETGRMYIISRTDASRFGYFDFIRNESYLESKNCKDCQDNRYKIISQTSSSLVLQIKPQDAGQFFVYQFTFIKL